MKELHIAVLPGDGIGPEVVEQALNVTLAVGKKLGHTILHETAPVGACAIEETGSPYPDSTHELCMRSDAVLFGAIGSPKYDNNPNAKVRPEQGLLAMRKKLGLFANIRPITTFPGLIHKSPLRAELIDGADFMCIRELTGGLYFGRPQGRSEDGSVAYDTCMYSREEITRIVQLAYDYAMRRRKKVTMVDKANILARVGGVVEHEVGHRFPLLVVAPVAEEVFAESLARYGFEESGRNDLVGVDIFLGKGNARRGYDIYFFNHGSVKL